MIVQRISISTGLLCAVLFPVSLCVPAAAQQPDTTGQLPAVVVDTSGAGAWNDARALSLIAAARARRQAPLADSALQNYRAHAEGFVYFYIDRRDSDERTLVKIDQVALDLFWAQPDRTRQRIVGMRDVSRLPNRMYYHLDHLTVVQNGFGDVIRMGDGDEVRDVLHPAARGSEGVYDFRLADSLTLVLPGAPEPVRVYEVQVRPRDPQKSGFVGSVFIDRARGDVVRMTFTFTPASYVDRRLDYINVSLDSGLWDGRYWLPYEQAVELRRQVPELDFIGGAVIRGRMRIGNYEFNTQLPSTTFVGPAVSVVSRNALEQYEFERDLYADLAEEGLAPPPEMTELRQEAARLLRAEKLSGLPKLRLSVPSVSSVLRYNRLEGAFAGAGLAYVPGARFRLDTHAGYACGAGEPAASISADYAPAPGWTITGRAYHNRLRDVGFRPGLPMALNTITSVFAADDYSDPYLVSGGSLGVERQLGLSWSIRAGARFEEQHAPEPAGEPVEPAGISDEEDFARTLVAVEHGPLLAGTLLLRREPVEGALTWSAEIELEPGRLNERAYARAQLTTVLSYRTADLVTDGRLRASAGVVSQDAPAQRQFLLGGRETLPGYAYRSFAGSRFALIDAEVTRDLAAPWVRVRALGAIGWSAAGTIGRLFAHPELFDPRPGGFIGTAPIPDTDGLRTSVGIGASALWDQLRLDVVRGLNGGEWQLLFSIAPDFWSML